MGFFSSKSFGGIVSGALTGGLLGGPGGAVVGGLLGGLGGASDAAAAKQQEDALRRAGRIEEAERLRAQQFQQQILSETAGFRELGREQIPFLREEAAAAPGTSPLFQRGLERGITDIQSQLAARGLADSSTAGQAIGEFGAGLAAQDINRLTGLRQGLAGLGTLGFGQGLQGQQLASNLALTRAQTEANIGALQGQGGFGQQIAQLGGLGLIAGLGGLGGVQQAPGGAGGGGGGAGGGFIPKPPPRRRV